MSISPATLLAQYRNSLFRWPYIPDIEHQYRLPRCLLVAVASRETNCTNEVGDGGHGHGVFQYDDRSHQIPAGFDSDVRLQANTAAAMLRGLIDAFAGDVRSACAAYNAGAGSVRRALSRGQDPDSVTTGRNYGRDVIDRMTYLQTATPATAPAVPAVPTAPAAPPVVTVYPEDQMQTIDTQTNPLDDQGNGYLDEPVDPHKVINVVFNVGNPPDDHGYPSVPPRWGRRMQDGQARIVFYGGTPHADFACTVWSAS